MFRGPRPAGGPAPAAGTARGPPQPAMPAWRDLGFSGTVGGQSGLAHRKTSEAPVEDEDPVPISLPGVSYLSLLGIYFMISQPETPSPEPETPGRESRALNPWYKDWASAVAPSNFSRTSRTYVLTSPETPNQRAPG